MEDILAASASAQAAAIRGGVISSREVVQAQLHRAQYVNPRLNALVQVNPAALDEAEEADRRRTAGEAVGPLHGVPFTVKDWIEAAGLVCAAGFAARKEFVPRADATVVARMRAAGGILLGKTNVQETNPVYGDTRNPYDATRSPGASTSGEAALIAAGGSPLGLGSDSGGSLLPGTLLWRGGAQTHNRSRAAHRSLPAHRASARPAHGYWAAVPACRRPVAGAHRVRRRRLARRERGADAA